MLTKLNNYLNKSLNFTLSRVSVIIPSYNRSVILPEAIESVFQQTYPVWEIIVVDDGSTDQTKEVCACYPTIKYIYQNNQGVSAARNTGIKASRGNYLLFLDSDDRLLPQAVEIGLNAINAHPEVGFVFGRYDFLYINSDGSYTLEESSDNVPEVASYATILDRTHTIFCPSCALVKHNVAEAVGGFNPKLKSGEVTDFFLRIARDFPIHFHNQVVFEYRYNGNNVSANAAVMLVSTLYANRLQWSYIQQTGNQEYAAAYDRGKQALLKLFIGRIPYQISRYLSKGNWVSALNLLQLILTYDPKLEFIDQEVYETSYQATLSQLGKIPFHSSFAYGQKQLAAFATPLFSPSIAPRSEPAQTCQIVSQSFVLSQELTTALNIFSKQQKLPLYTTLLSAFYTLLYRYTGIEEIVVGSLIIEPTTIERITHFFINTVALRTDLSGNPSFQKLLKQVQKVSAQAQSHQDLPLEMLMETLHSQQDLSYSPLLFQVMFAFEDISLQKNEPLTLIANPWVNEDGTTKFILTLVIEQTSEEIVGKWVCNTNFFDADTIERMNKHFQTLLGAIYVPIDPAFPKDRLTYLFSDSQALVLLTQENLLPRLPDHQAQVICLDTNLGVISQESQANPVSDVQSKNLAYVIYTSGSTGKPKGVAIEHKSIVNYLNGMLEHLDMGSGSNWAFVSTIAADLGHTILFCSLCTGGCLHVVSKERASNPNAFADYFDSNSIDCLKIVPSHFAALQTPLHPERILPRQRLIMGGEACRSDWVENLQLKSPQCTILNHYGPTETTVGVLTYEVGEKLSDSRTLTLPLGRPLANTQIYILDHHLQPLPIGVPGELHIGGAGLARGYLNRPELTCEKFIHNPFSDEPDARLYKTGDLARYLPDGNIEFLGRTDHQVKIRGFRIETGEIEALLSQHPSVQENVVIAREDEQGNKRLVAYIVVHQQQTIATSELRQFLNKQLPDYMVPSAFVMLEALPLTPNGKIDRHALPATDLSHREAENTIVQPRNELEQQLILIWEQVLGVKPIGVQDNFFDLGGHSLLAIRLLNEIEQTSNIKIPLAALFQLTTVEQMASFFHHENHSVGDSIQEQVLDSPTTTELVNKSSPEYSGLTTDEYKALLVIVAGRKGKRPRQNSLMVAINQQGVKPPLFFCANAWEEAFALAKNLGKEQPFYLLETGLAVTGNVEDKVKNIASYHVQDILAVQPEPPYLLGGYSFGSLVAYEIAQQLLAKGKPVSLVFFLDRYGFHPNYKLYKTIVYFITDHRNQLAPLSFNHKLRYIQGNLKRLISKKFLKPSNNNEENKVKNQSPYIPQPYPGKVIIFCGIPNRREPIPPGRFIPIIPEEFTLFLFKRAGWAQHTMPNLKILTTSGDHVSMREEPHVKLLAAKLKVCLDEAILNEER